MIREIDGGSSHLSQNSTIAHFGLGLATIIDSVIVTWVGGKNQILLNQKGNQVIKIQEKNNKKWYYPFRWLPGVMVAVILLFIFLRKRNLLKFLLS